MRLYYLLLVFLIPQLHSAQTAQNTYKYAIVPNQYSFTSEPNQFQVNVLTRVYLKDAGFEVYMEEGEEMPEELSENSCLALKANVIKEKGLFASNLLFQLKNCYGKVVFESRGSSRKKAYKDAYREALEIALNEFLIESGNYLMKKGDTTPTAMAEDLAADGNAQDDRPFKDVAIKYTLAENAFWLLKKGNSYILYEDEGETVYATLDSADRGTYTYDSADIDGAAYFNPNGDLIVEYLAKDKVDVQKLEFKKQ